MVPNLAVFTNGSFKSFWGSDRQLSFNFSLPRELVGETELMKLKHGCLIMETYSDIESSVTRFLASLQSCSYVENTLSKRHIYDYVSSESLDLRTTVDLFSSYAILVRSKVDQIGVKSALNFIWSHNFDSDYSSPTMSFHRFSPSDVCVDFESLESFHQERILALRI